MFSLNTRIVKPILESMRDDIRRALRGRSVTFLGANRELRKLPEYLHDDERVDDVAACKFDTAGGRAIVVATDERIIVVKNGWILRSSQSMAYKDVRSIDINTGVFFATIDFHGEGVDPFKISNVGRFAADHIVKLIRERTGSRYHTWERQRQQEKHQLQQQQAAMSLSTPVTSAQPVVPQQPLSDRLEDYVGITSQSLNPVSLPGPQHIPNPTNPNVQQLHFPPTNPTPAPQPVNLLAELEKLEEQYKQGLLSDGQFQFAKKKLLGG